MSKELKFNQPAKCPLPEDFVFMSDIKFVPVTNECYDGDKTNMFMIDDELGMFPSKIKETIPDNKKKFVFLVMKAENCLFSRRMGYRGNIICGYSFVVRLFGWNLTKW